MTKHESKRLLSLILALVMVATLIVVPVYADSDEADTTSGVAKIGDTTYETLAAAIAAAENGDTIELISDVTDKAFNLKRNISVTLDLNGYDITCTDNSSYPYSPIYVTAGNLTVTDSKATDGVSTSVLSTTKTNGTVFVTGGSVTINAGNYYSYSTTGQTLQMGTDATSSKVTINGGTFTSVGYGMQVQAGELVITGGTIASSASSIGDSTYTPTVKGAVLVRATDGISPKLTITGGYFTSKYNDAGMIVYVVDKTTTEGVSYDYESNISISGGYYDMNNYSVARYVADGYEVTENSGSDEDTYPYAVTAIVATEGSTGYGYATIDGDGNVTSTLTGTWTDISGAIYRANLAKSDDNYGYVQLTGDVTSAIYVPADTKIILDLNGQSVNVSDATAIQVAAGAEVILIDSVGTATVTSNKATAGTVRNAGGTLTIYGGTYTNTDTTNAYSPVIYSAVAASDTATSSDATATTTICGGTYDSKGRIIHLNLGTATIKGGTFKAKAMSYGKNTENTVTYPDGYALSVANTETTDGVTYYTWNVTAVLGMSSDSTTQVPVEVVSGEDTNTVYVKVSDEYIGNGYYSTEAYPTTDLTYTPDNSTDSGNYIFAGWYTLDDESSYVACTETMWENDTNEATEYYAKFVDANVLSVKCVFTPTSVTKSGNAWRFLSSEDTKQYQDMFFVIYNTDGTEQYRTTSTMRHSESCTVGSNKFIPSEFSTASNYVVTASYMDTTSTNTTYIVVPCWITLEGTTVSGMKFTFASEGVTAQTVLSSTTTSN